MEAKPEVPKAEPPKEAPKAKPRPSFEHPVLRMMGIPRIRVPSRNWSIFWGVTALFFGGLYYDRSTGRKIRAQHKKEVEFLSEKPINGLELPRKVKVYMTPPPSDTIEVSNKHWRQNVKPILTAASIDFEIIDEDKQGHIRTVVAEDIRNKRRAAQGLPTTGYQPDSLDHKINDKLVANPSGGVICIGRGAYKEYLAGVQEGWLGPLEEPEFVKDERAKQELEKQKAEQLKREENGESEPNSTPAAAPEASPQNLSPLHNVPIPKPETEPKETKPEAPAQPKKEVTPSWLRAEHYADAELDPLFYHQSLDPVLVVRNPHILGFLRTPQRFGRFMTRRWYVDEANTAAKSLVLEQIREMRPEDVDLKQEEEQDWPSKWKQQGRDKNSEWMREFKLDDRLVSHLRIYDSQAPAQVSKPSESEV